MMFQKVKFLFVVNILLISGVHADIEVMEFDEYIGKIESGSKPYLSHKIEFSKEGKFVLYTQDGKLEHIHISNMNFTQSFVIEKGSKYSTLNVFDGDLNGYDSDRIGKETLPPSLFGKGLDLILISDINTGKGKILASGTSSELIYAQVNFKKDNESSLLSEYSVDLSHGDNCHRTTKIENSSKKSFNDVTLFQNSKVSLADTCLKESSERTFLLKSVSKIDKFSIDPEKIMQKSGCIITDTRLNPQGSVVIKKDNQYNELELKNKLEYDSIRFQKKLNEEGRPKLLIGLLISISFTALLIRIILKRNKK
jgi:hypothetical protein